MPVATPMPKMAMMVRRLRMVLAPAGASRRWGGMSGSSRTRPAICARCGGCRRRRRRGRRERGRRRRGGRGGGDVGGDEGGGGESGGDGGEGGGLDGDGGGAAVGEEAVHASPPVGRPGWPRSRQGRSGRPRGDGRGRPGRDGSGWRSCV